MVVLLLWVRQVLTRNAIQVARMRSRIADDLHDDIGSKLTAVSLTLDFIKDKQELTGNDLEVLRRQAVITAKLVDDLRDSVWSVDHEKDTLIHLVQHMELFARSVNIRNNISIDRPSDLPPLLLGMEWRRHVYLIFKEALNNAVTHNKAPEVDIRITVHKSTFGFTIENTGQGFDTQSVYKGRGLVTMQRRARDIGGEIFLESSPGKGVVFRFRGQLV